MDYARVAQIMESHAQTLRASTGIVLRHNPHMKKLKNKTWLVKRPANNDETPDEYGLRVFGKEIITYYYDRVELNDRGFFSRTTHDRFNEFLPNGFRVRGQTLRAVDSKRPFGFITTPAGTFAYSMPIAFRYSGESTLGRFNNAQAALEAIPGYVDAYLKSLFNNGPFDETDGQDRAWQTFVLQHSTEEDDPPRDVRTARAILKGRLFRKLVVYATEDALPTISVGDFGYVVSVLAEEGIKAFRKLPGAKNEKARHMERLLTNKPPVPRLTYYELRRLLRRPLIDFLIRRLCFDDVNWNGR